MGTREITPKEMDERISRYSKLQPLKIQQEAQAPLEVLDMIYSRELLPVIGLEEGESALTDAPPIRGAAGMTMTLARCPSGTGPGLHSHQDTYETFTVLSGKFEFVWGDSGEHSVLLDTFDTISVPPRCCRAFKNISKEDGLLQVLITGGVHDMNDINFHPDIGRAVSQGSPEFKTQLDKRGMQFTAVPE
ncbi:cupin domain-containing protein [Myxococcota bacterium]|jgi:uncharacterized RmlC-like cupin family protein|nr:cupin domain-containing protein [Myxococcota bacterium]|tara:strand:- start:882 stop:1451 length:570 start_codon:yes stop_codon:yes gene_type:complete